MPFYTYKCKDQKCDHEFETINSIANRENQTCEKCGSECNVLISRPRYRGHVTFEPGYFEHLDHEPVYINDRAHLKRECLARGKWAPGVLD